MPTLLKDSHAFSGFAVKDLAEAKAFYSETLGLKVTSGSMGAASGRREQRAGLSQGQS